MEFVPKEITYLQTEALRAGNILEAVDDEGVMYRMMVRIEGSEPLVNLRIEIDGEEYVPEWATDTDDLTLSLGGSCDIAALNQMQTLLYKADAQPYLAHARLIFLHRQIDGKTAVVLSSPVLYMTVMGEQYSMTQD